MSGISAKGISIESLSRGSKLKERLSIEMGANKRIWNRRISKKGILNERTYRKREYAYN